MFLAEKHCASFIENLKTRRNFIAWRNFRRFTFIFRLIFRSWLHILKDSSPILEHLQIREPLPIFKEFLKCMAPITYTYVTKYEGFAAFYFSWTVLKKTHKTRDGVSITLNCLSHELGASLNNISVFPEPVYSRIRRESYLFP